MFNRDMFLSDMDLDVDAIIALAGRAGVEVPERDTVRKWFERASIPGHWWPVLIALVELDRGQPISLLPYVSLGRAADVFS